MDKTKNWTIVRKARKAGKLSQLQLADQLKVSRAYISQIESGVKAPSSALLQKMAVILGIEHDLLSAAAGKVSEDVRKIILSDPVKYCQIIRRASCGDAEPKKIKEEEKESNKEKEEEINISDNNIYITNINNTENAPARALSICAKNPKNADFEEFWRIYPQKTPKGSKKYALSSYLVAITKITKEDLHHAATNYAEYISRTTISNAHASSWLRGERWEDFRGRRGRGYIEGAGRVSTGKRDLRGGNALFAAAAGLLQGDNDISTPEVKDVNC